MRKSTVVLATLLACGVATTAQAGKYERYSKAQQCYGWSAVSGEHVSSNLIMDIINKDLSKGDLIGTALHFKGLSDKRKFKVGLMCALRYKK